MRETDQPILSRLFTGLVPVAALLFIAFGGASEAVTAQTLAAQIDVPDLGGVWDGGFRVRPVNGPNMPWTPDNFPVLNERAVALAVSLQAGEGSAIRSGVGEAPETPASSPRACVPRAGAGGEHLGF